MAISASSYVWIDTQHLVITKMSHLVCAASYMCPSLIESFVHKKRTNSIVRINPTSARSWTCCRYSQASDGSGTNDVTSHHYHQQGFRCLYAQYPKVLLGSFCDGSTSQVDPNEETKTTMHVVHIVGENPVSSKARPKFQHSIQHCICYTITAKYAQGCALTTLH